MKKYKGFRREWAKIRSASHYSEIRYAMMGLCRMPVFGMYTVLPIPDKWLMEVAKDDAMRRQIKQLRQSLSTLPELRWQNLNGLFMCRRLMMQRQILSGKRQLAGRLKQYSRSAVKRCGECCWPREGRGGLDEKARTSEGTEPGDVENRPA